MQPISVTSRNFQNLNDDAPEITLKNPIGNPIGTIYPSRNSHIPYFSSKRFSRKVENNSLLLALQKPQVPATVGGIKRKIARGFICKSLAINKFLWSRGGSNPRPEMTS